MTDFAHIRAHSPRARILLVEDDREIAGMLRDSLSEHGFDAVVAQSGLEMDKVLRKQDFDLVILDVMLPGENGFAICRRLRLETQMPIIMLTAMGGDTDRIIGLEFGADDYVTKPFNSRELIARIRGLLRRAAYATPSVPRPEILTFAGWQINPVTRQLTDPDGVHISMTTAEFDLLLAFCENPGRVLSREQLLSLTHAGLAGPVERSVDVHISRVRQKIEPEPKEPVMIKTVRLGGYLFTPTVERI
ncbi:response regulator [Labrys okinawensis]|uniref:response regulator n=1 Tax=Labrys okinawensis TaxID=346911 RepID=UPI0039BD1C34